MVLTASKMLALGTIAPDFHLPDTVSGQNVSLKALQSPMATVIMFICNHCPYVKHIQHALVQLANHYQSEGIAFIAINSNDVSQYPEDAPDKMTEVAQKWAYPFPYLYDESQTVARAYQAVCTPDFYIFDKALRCVYRGQMDGARPGNTIDPNGQDIRAALNNILQGLPVNPDQTPSIGCNIKWKEG
jgi:peroxiredoxin